MMTLWRTASMRAFMAGILGVGIVRFLLTVAGMPNSTVKYFSMTAVLAAGAIYFAVFTNKHRERLVAAFLLIFPYMLVEVAALLYTWSTGNRTIFHAAEYSFGFSIGLHTLGHLVGGLTWEPLSLFLFMELIWAVCTLAGWIISKL